MIMRIMIQKSTASSASIISRNPKLSQILSDKRRIDAVSAKIVSKDEMLKNITTEIPYEAISLGKKSIKSGSSGNNNSVATGKRGRPKKSLQVSLSK